MGKFRKILVAQILFIPQPTPAKIHETHRNKGCRGCGCIWEFGADLPSPIQHVARSRKIAQGSNSRPCFNTHL